MMFTEREIDFLALNILTQNAVSTARYFQAVNDVENSWTRTAAIHCNYSLFIITATESFYHFIKLRFVFMCASILIRVSKVHGRFTPLTSTFEDIINTWNLFYNRSFYLFRILFPSIFFVKWNSLIITSLNAEGLFYGLK